MTRQAEIVRATSETDIRVSIDLDGTGETEVATGVPFFDHMLDAFGRHGQFSLRVAASGDTDVDAHHTVEDVGICLGMAFAKALGEKVGITRFGSAVIPMDEALVLCAIDVSGRGLLTYDLTLPIEIIGTFDTTLAKEFLVAFASQAGMTVHVHQFAGENSHHIIEAVFKALARAVRESISIDPRVAGVPSTKGAL